MRDTMPKYMATAEELKKVKKEVEQRAKKGISASELKKVMAPSKKGKAVKKISSKKMG
ncbi:hypothetical protein [Candidatus Aquicultor secundus]|uniref:hypothetical protein n=1 Tax=Candidatus Aquicultor secundus TaxID=1973895 RepID=UPI00257A5BB8|nr:hypothetical protein [Candidatus Aquicultor secundus]NCO66775.1 hypothetical protein [Solirubrobacter sp.]